MFDLQAIHSLNHLVERGFERFRDLPAVSSLGVGTQVAILDERGAELPSGEIGEICVRGPQVMRGYWNAPEETARAFTAGGWLRTGDLGRIDARELAPYKQPRLIEFRDSLPKSPIGKVLHRELKPSR